MNTPFKHLPLRAGVIDAWSFIPGGTGVDTADALPRLQAVAPLHDPLVGYRELAEAVEVALLLKEVPRDKQYCSLIRKF